MSALLTCGTCTKGYSVNAASCIHCGEPNPVKVKVEEKVEEKRWYHLMGNVLGLLILIYPVGVYYMWKGDHFPAFVKWLLTGLLVVFVLAVINDDGKTQTPLEKRLERLQSNP